MAKLSMAKTSKSEKTILIVEDDLSLMKALAGAFKRVGIRTILAVDGGAAYDLAINKKPDLILLDIVLPKIDGLTVLKKLRLDPWGKDVPVILLTNLNSPEKVAEATEFSVSDYLIKTDWKIEDVIKKVKQRLNIG